MTLKHVSPATLARGFFNSERLIREELDYVTSFEDAQRIAYEALTSLRALAAFVIGQAEGGAEIAYDDLPWVSSSADVVDGRTVIMLTDEDALDEKVQQEAQNQGEDVSLLNGAITTFGGGESPGFSTDQHQLIRENAPKPGETVSTALGGTFTFIVAPVIKSRYED
jgi:hypothetical protein